MSILTPIEFTYVRFATDEEKVKEYYLVRDGMFNVRQFGYVQLEQNYTVTLKEISDIYKRIVAKYNLQEGEQIKSLKVDLTPYYEYNSNGTPVYASEENPIAYDRSKKKTATYNSKHNRLIIWERDLPVYENNDGIICTDGAALADSLLP